MSLVNLGKEAITDFDIIQNASSITITFKRENGESTNLTIPKPKGPDGLNGNNGQDGGDGTTGPAGPGGNRGSQGPRGRQGDAGAAGPRGPRGGSYDCSVDPNHVCAQFHPNANNLANCAFLGSIQN